MSSLTFKRYSNQVYWDLVDQFPELSSKELVPKVESIQFHWNRRDIGMNADVMSGAWTFMSMIAGLKELPKAHRSKVHVAALQLREKDVVGCSVELKGNDMYNFLDGFIYRVIPRIRPFDGFSSRYIDEAGTLSVPIVNPLVFPQVEVYYELFQPRSGAGSQGGGSLGGGSNSNGLTMLIKTNASKAGGDVDQIRGRSRSLLSGLGLKMIP